MSQDPSGDRIGAFGYVQKHYSGLHLWRKVLLVVSITATVAGAVGVVAGKFTAPPAAETTAAPAITPTTPTPPPANSTGNPKKIEDLRNGSAQPLAPSNNFSAQDVKDKAHEIQVAATQKAQAVADEAVIKARWFYDQFSPNLLQIGLSFFVAFVAGYAFRQFIKTMATLAAIVVVGAIVVQVAGWADVVGMLKGHATEARDLGGQAFELAKAIVVEKLPMSATGTIGFIVGFLRKR